MSSPIRGFESSLEVLERRMRNHAGDWRPGFRGDPYLAARRRSQTLQWARGHARKPTGTMLLFKNVKNPRVVLFLLVVSVRPAVQPVGGNDVVEQFRRWVYANFPEAEDWGTVVNRMTRQGGSPSEHCDWADTTAKALGRSWGDGGNATDVRIDDVAKCNEMVNKARRKFGDRVVIVWQDDGLHDPDVVAAYHAHVQGRDDHPSHLRPRGLGGTA